ncbi:hypothetical protein A2165_04055 [Candidatus Curtissbacteria bacterium RBG_13_40_7]|uniref:Phosphatidylglycerol--prolipoprotein diacylglyceryl transferase n=1 Tax=Candidatus Curtissbacteria bacterium RBG_13_40_7 TaxID=1797706 RepID=A0A1F5FZG3_9BACT|nr:MAG: hypothetical protein A2165_04055 [Candidatus Curtissbacteria bacterium RBG_13_40_7]
MDSRFRGNDMKDGNDNKKRIMIPSAISLGFLSIGIYPVSLVLIILISAFLFWRAGRHEFVESELLFDFILITSVGALFLGRIFDFIIRSDFYGWSISRLIFFNIYRGFDFYGAILGGIVAGAVYLRIKKVNPWHIFDFLAAPLVLAQSLSALVLFLIGQISTRQIIIPWQFRMNQFSLPIFSHSFYYFATYLAIFWILKRLATQKKHIGFFACFYLVFVPLVDLLFSIFLEKKIPSGSRLWQDIVDLLLILFGLVFWYVLTKRKLISDVKSIFGAGLLGIFRFLRIITSIEEAGKLSRALVFSPLYLLRSVVFVVKLIYSQVLLGFVDFIGVFKTKK